MIFQRFEDIIAWQKSQDLAVSIYSVFNDLRDYGFRDQITRAVVSISNNIAEGFNRGTDKEFSKFLSYSMSSTSEVKSMLYLAQKLNYIADDNCRELIAACNEVSRILVGLQKSLNT